MGRPFHFEVAESIEYLAEQHKKELHPKVKQRLHMLYLYQAGLASSLNELCLQLNKSHSQVKRWIQLYKSKGLEALLKTPVHSGRKRNLSESALSALNEKLDTASFTSFKEIHTWLVEEWGVTLGYHAVWHQVRHLGAKLKTARPCAIGRDEEAVVEFKKNSAKR